jgi:hypothetical protein
VLIDLCPLGLGIFLREELAEVFDGARELRLATLLVVVRTESGRKGLDGQDRPDIATAVTSAPQSGGQEANRY